MKVYLIGAGPGDAGLLTLKGRDALACADVVVYDALANDSLLGHARPDAERIYVGKVAGNHALPQHEINALLVRKAKEGKVVARLKGGDPYIFGPGLCGHPADPPQLRLVGDHHHRPREPGQARFRAQLEGPGRQRLHPGLRHGHEEPARHRPAPAGHGHGSRHPGRAGLPRHHALPAQPGGHHLHPAPGRRGQQIQQSLGHRGGQGLLPARPAGLVRTAPAVRPQHRGHPRPRTGQRPGPKPDRTGRQRHPVPHHRDQPPGRLQRAGRGRGPSGRIRLDHLHLGQRRAPLLEAPGRLRP